MKDEKENITHSIRDRLTNISQERNENYQIILTRFAFERFLYRLQKSQYSKRLILKGAFLFNVWTSQYYRPTKDVDFLADISNQPDLIQKVFKEICEIEIEFDGLIYDSENISVKEIIEGSTYRGLRVKLMAKLEKVRIYLQFDIGFGDVVYPAVNEIEYPSLLDFPKPRVMAYPIESLISEKVEAMVSLGMQNSRMKDFYDVYSLIKIFDIDRNSLKQAISATFRRRDTIIPDDIPIGLSDEFATDRDKIAQWKQFINKNELTNVPGDFINVIQELRTFLMPLLESVKNGIEVDE